MANLNTRKILLLSVLYFSATFCVSQNTGYFGKKNLIGIETLSCLNNNFLEREREIFKYNKNTSKIILKYGFVYERILTKKTNIFATAYFGKGKSEFEKMYDVSIQFGVGKSALFYSYLSYNQVGASIGFKIFKNSAFNPIGKYKKFSGGIVQNTIQVNSKEYLERLDEKYLEKNQDYIQYLQTMKITSNVFYFTFGIGNQLMLNDYLALDLCINLNAGMNYSNFFRHPKYKYQIEEDVDILGTKNILLQNALLFAVALKFVR